MLLIASWLIVTWSGKSGMKAPMTKEYSFNLKTSAAGYVLKEFTKLTNHFDPLFSLFRHIVVEISDTV